MQTGSVFHVILWSSHTAKCPNTSIGGAKALAFREGIDVGKSIADCYRVLINVTIDLIIVVDSKNLYTTLSAQRLSVDKSMRGDIGIIRHEFEIGNISKFICLRGKINSAEIGTKSDRALISAANHILQGRVLL